MKVIGKRSVASVFKFILGVAWYLQWGLFLFGLGVLLVVFVRSDYVDNDLPVLLREHQQMTGLAATNSKIWDESLKLNQGILHYKTTIDWQVVLYSLSYLFGLFALTLSITYLLRKIFGTLTQETPFIPENAYRLRKIAGLIMLLAPLRLLLDLYQWHIVSSRFTLNGDVLLTQWDFDFQTLLIGFVLLVIAEVFRVGTQLQQENELTV